MATDKSDDFGTQKKEGDFGWFSSGSVNPAVRARSGRLRGLRITIQFL